MEIETFGSLLSYLNFDQKHFTCNMVCAKCQKLKKKTELATPGVQRKSDLYLGSPNASTERGKSSATSKASGIGKVG